jgi:hypothetical protein
MGWDLVKAAAILEEVAVGTCGDCSRIGNACRRNPVLRYRTARGDGADLAASGEPQLAVAPLSAVG